MGLGIKLSFNNERKLSRSFLRFLKTGTDTPEKVKKSVFKDTPSLVFNAVQGTKTIYMSFALCRIHSDGFTPIDIGYEFAIEHLRNIGQGANNKVFCVIYFSERKGMRAEIKKAFDRLPNGGKLLIVFDSADYERIPDSKALSIFKMKENN